jgi:hypothetical protein
MGKLITVCCSCRRVRLKTGHWMRRFVATVVTGRAPIWVRDPEQSHGYCPDCMRRDYPEVAARMEAEAAHGI